MDCRVGTKVPPRNDKTRHAGLDPASHSHHGCRLRITEVNPSPAMTGKHLLTYSPTNLLTLKSTPHPVFRFSANAQNRKQTSPSRGEVKRVAFTKPSRGTSVARGEGKSTETFSFRCLPERCRFMRGAAFTLAEVLITLGIIGVVAAMTMPVLITKYQKNVMKTQFKKSYANITNTINFVQAKNGYNYECYAETVGTYGLKGYNTNQCKQFWDEVLKEMKVIKTCNYKDDNCGVLYKDRPKVLSEGGATNNPSCSYLAEDVGAKVYVLYDGSYVIITGGSNHHQVYFTLDVNGEKSPNKWGYDVFYLMLDAQGSTSSIRITDNICALKEKGGFYANEMLSKNQ